MTEEQEKKGSRFSATSTSSTNNYLTCNDLHHQAGIEELPSGEKTEETETKTQHSQSISSDTADGKACAETRWFVMRDLKRRNAKNPAYKMLRDESFEVFTPMKKCQTVRFGRKVIEDVPVIHDLLFVHSRRESLDHAVERTPTLQYRYLKGGGYREPAVVRDADMDKFVNAVNSTVTPKYYTPDELTPGMIGSRVRIIGGPLNGYEARLLNIRGSRKKRIMVELPGVIVAGVEVKPEYIQIIKEWMNHHKATLPLLRNNCL